MKSFIKEQNLYIKSYRDKADPKTLFEYCSHQIIYLSHERIAHLLVTLFVAMLLISFLVLTFVFEHVLFIFLVCLLGILEIFYIMHYYLLENTLQKWYDYANELDKTKLGLPIGNAYMYTIETPFESYEECLENCVEIRKKTYLAYVFDYRISGTVNEHGEFRLSCRSGNASYFEFIGIIVEQEKKYMMKGNLIIKPFVKVFMNTCTIIIAISMIPFLVYGQWPHYILYGIVWVMVIINYSMFLNPKSLIKAIQKHYSKYKKRG